MNIFECCIKIYCKDTIFEASNSIVNYTIDTFKTQTTIIILWYIYKK